MKKPLIILAMLMPLFLLADEGMWQPHQLPELKYTLTQQGLAFDIAHLSNQAEAPLNAVVSFADCTASFVSAEGLLLTNYQCGYERYTQHNTGETPIHQRGFLARQTAEELPAQAGTYLYVTEQVVDVTDHIIQQSEDISEPLARHEAIAQRRQDMVRECEQEQGYRCRIFGTYSGLEYYLVKQLEIRDVRLVYLPAKGIGQFGGLHKRWKWPRHTGDFVFYRAYVGPDGKPADYAAENKPFVPSSFLTVSAQSVEEKDFVMALGYPLKTNRYCLSTEVETKFNKIYPAEKAFHQQAIEVIRQFTAQNNEAAQKYQQILDTLANDVKWYDGMIQSYHSGETLSRKMASEQRLINWINANKHRREEFAPVLEKLSHLIEQSYATQQRDRVLHYFSMAKLPELAKRLYQLAQERRQAETERQQAALQQNITRFTEESAQLAASMDSRVDLELALHFLQHYAALPAEMRLPHLDRFFGMADGFNLAIVRHKLEAMYRRTQLSDDSERAAWLTRTVEDFQQSDDPMIAYAVAMYKTDQKLEKQQKMLRTELETARARYMQILFAFEPVLGKPVYPDANGMLRISYGSVRGYYPKDGIWFRPFTTAPGLLAKVTAEVPYNAPDKQVAALQRGNFDGFRHPRYQTLPINFLSTIDAGTGFSGAPTLNGKAELVGLLSDGVPESIIGDWDYDIRLNRAIHVDSRYILWQLQQVDNAGNLLNEISISR